MRPTARLSCVGERAHEAPERSRTTAISLVYGPIVLAIYVGMLTGQPLVGIPRLKLGVLISMPIIAGKLQFMIDAVEKKNLTLLARRGFCPSYLRRRMADTADAGR